MARFAEAQHRVATMKLVDDLDEQALLEDLLDDSKPPVPRDCAHLHYLFYTPFRYVPHSASRFRGAGDARGVLYAAETLRTAAAEAAFHLLRFYIESPDTGFPSGPTEKTAFRLGYETAARFDLTGTTDPALTDPVDYTATVALAEALRAEGAEVIRYRSVRDPDAGANIAILTCAAITSTAPEDRAIWHFWLKSDRVIAREHAGGGESHEFSHTAFDGDPRVRDWLSRRDASG
ncbi:RES family NAD+ phosphorylase [Actibacterium sp. XHP0104]|uniref:RES family NAD+ phosphorylase n=1 Tax=Actibacterium sp. XHP0104 TaxID=2984335 RepID=UPI0021E7FC14|nr:RES family NAD+ phosphorylase [Actibacterium sp. XHP0104]